MKIRLDNTGKQTKQNFLRQTNKTHICSSELGYLISKYCKNCKASVFRKQKISNFTFQIGEKYDLTSTL